MDQVPSDPQKGVLFVTFSGAKWPPCGWSKGHDWNEAGKSCPLGFFIAFPKLFDLAILISQKVCFFSSSSYRGFERPLILHWMDHLEIPESRLLRSIDKRQLCNLFMICHEDSQQSQFMIFQNDASKMDEITLYVFFEHDDSPKISWFQKQEGFMSPRCHLIFSTSLGKRWGMYILWESSLRETT